ncbi:MAG: hypothetical protein DRJ42_30695 [Deltaproteobacteria bacterium]|nr:MAG: hypothetical protein DRJ42_30695 [Deltaproteobacteria bacterium]
MIRSAVFLIAAAMLLVLFAGCERAAPAPAPPSPDVEGAEAIVIVARVVDAPRPPPCGTSTFRVAVRYAVLEVEAGALTETDILVRQDCPEGPRPAGDAGPIEVDAVHRLTLEAMPLVTARRVQWIPIRTDAATGTL